MMITTIQIVREAMREAFESSAVRLFMLALALGAVPCYLLSLAVASVRG